jgi:hypothetical protein
MSEKLSFMGRIGYVSGFDPSKDATVMLLLETLLACYARIAIQRNDSGNDILLRAITIVDNGIQFGRHFILLPETGTHVLFKVDFTSTDQPEGNVSRTVVESHMNPYQLLPANEDTIVDERGSTLNEIEDAVIAPGYKLYYIDIRDPATSTKDTVRTWKSNGFYMFAIRSTLGDKISWNYVAFFNRLKTINAEISSVNQYLRHVVAGNLSTTDIKPRTLNRLTGRMEHAKVPPISPIEIVSTQTSNSLQLPENVDKYHIVPSVSFVDGRANVLVPWAHPYAETLTRYIDAVHRSIEINSVMKIKINTIRKEPDYTIAFGDGTEELVIITIITIPKTGQQRSSIAIRHSSIARVIFGSNPAWARETLGSNVLVSSPGFGCLDYGACSKIIKDADDKKETLWQEQVDSSYRNNRFNEMLGRTSDEIDSMLFTDSSFFRSFIGRSASYAEAVGHWMKEVMEFDRDAITLAKREIQEAYKEALKPFIMNELNDLCISASRGEEVGISGKVVTSRAGKDSRNFIIILQEGHLNSGSTKMSRDRVENLSKLLYEIDSNKFIAVSERDNTYKKPDGGIFLCCWKNNVVRNAERTLRDIRMDSGAANSREADEAESKINYSMSCPYSYFAHAFHKILQFTDNHLDFFVSTKVKGNPRFDAELDTVQNITMASVTMENNMLNANNTEFTLSKNKETRSMYLKNLYRMKEAFNRYIFTYDFLSSLVPLKKNDPINAAHNKQIIFALGLAFLLGARNSVKNPNIYELLPHTVNSGTFDESLFKDLEEAYPNVYRNIITNCDIEFRQKRLNIMRDVHNSISKKGYKFDITNFSCLDIVNASLLNDDFNVKLSTIAGYLHWTQYLAISASVIYAQKGITEDAIFLGDYAAKKLKGIEVDSSTADFSDVENFFIREPFEDGNGKMVDLLEFINKGCVKSIMPNIANVPIFSDGGQGPYSRDSLEDAVVVSTLDPALSVNSNFTYLISRSMPLRREGILAYKFDFIKGRNRQKKTGGVFLVEGSRPYLYEGNVVPQPPRAVLAEERPRAKAVSTWDQEVQVSTAYSRPSVDVIGRVRERINAYGHDYVNKADRTNFLIEFASHNRETLSRLSCTSDDISHGSTLHETINYQRTGVRQMLNLGKNASGINRDKEKAIYIGEYLQKIGVFGQ